MATRRAGGDREPSAAGAVHVHAGAIASRRNADRSTPTALALARQTVSSAAATRGRARSRSAGSSQLAGRQGGGGDAPARALLRRAGSRGFEGGRSHPRQSANVLHRVGWLTDLKKVSQPSAKPPKPPLRARSGAASTGPSRASSPASPSPFSRTARATGDPVTSLARAAALCRSPLFALPLPLGNPRSSISGDPSARRLPEMPPGHPETASEPVARSDQVSALRPAR